MLESDLERGAILLAHPVRSPRGAWRLVVSDTVVIPDADYTRQSSDSLEIPPHILVPAIKKARTDKKAIVLVHTHPWDGHVEPSPTDLDGEGLVMPTLFQRVPGVPHGRLILGRKDTSAALFEELQLEMPLQAIGVGRNVTFAPTLAQGAEFDNVFDRQVRAFGDAGQARLARLAVAIVGLGGTGSVVAQQLAHLGVRTFLLIDPDVVEQSNLNRVVGATDSDIGHAKVRVTERMIHRISPGADVVAVQEDVVTDQTARWILAADFFFSCTDTHGSRAVLTQLAYQYFIPGIDVGVRIDVSDGVVTDIVGRVQMLAPGLACTSCTGLLDPETVRRDLLTDEQRREDPYIVGGQAPQPSVITLNTTVAGFAVTMFLGAVTEAPLLARHQIMLFNEGVTKSIANTPDPGCIVCSSRGFFGRGDSWPAPGRPRS